MVYPLQPGSVYHCGPFTTRFCIPLWSLYSKVLYTIMVPLQQGSVYHYGPFTTRFCIPLWSLYSKVLYTIMVPLQQRGLYSSVVYIVARSSAYHSSLSIASCTWILVLVFSVHVYHFSHWNHYCRTVIVSGCSVYQSMVLISLSILLYGP